MRPLPTDQPFDYQLAMDRLRDYQAPRDKLRQLCGNGTLVRVKKGLYVPGWSEGDTPPVDPRVLSGLIYGPSYVSLESALSHYGLIPERVTEITCISTKRARQFRTPIGRFRYTPVNERVFSCGVRIESARGGNFLIAEPEKALCDRIARVRGLTTVREVAEVLEGELRIDMDALQGLRLDVVADIAGHYRRNNVSALHRWLVGYLDSASSSTMTAAS